MYKKIFIIFLVISFSLTTSFAKPSHRRGGVPWYSKLSFGPQIGGSFSWMNIASKVYEEVSFEKRNTTNTGSILWFTVGVAAEYMLLKQLGLSVEFLYGRTGMHILPDKKVKQESIISPILVTYYPSPQGANFQLHLGVQPSFAFATTYYKLAGGKDEELTEEEIEDEGDAPKESKLGVLDVAIVGGLSYRFNNSIEIGIRISRGLLERRELEAEHDSDDAEKETWRSISSQLYIGYNLAKLIK